jgi:hypothetical protein
MSRESELAAANAILDAAEVSDALEVYKQFDRSKLDKTLDKCSKYVDEVRKLCIAADVKSPFIDASIEMEKTNINLLCKQVFYAMHALDSVFERIDAQGGGMGEFAFLIKLQNDAMSLVQQYISYCRTLPNVLASLNNNVRATQAELQQGSGQSEQQSGINGELVTRSIVDLIKIAEKHNSTFEQLKDDNDDNPQPLFEADDEVAKLLGDDVERYTDEKTYAETMKAEGKEFNAEAELAKQAKPEVK